MNFPSFADTNGFIAFGARCATAVASSAGGVWDGCYSPIRPIGIIGYYTIPYFLTDDPVVMKYVILMMNLLVFLSVIAVMGWVMAHDPGFQPLRDSVLYGAAKAGLFLCVLFSFLGHLPITLADLPANGLFIMAMGVGCWILFPRSKGLHPFRYFLLGLLAAGSTLMKQNFVVFGGFLGLVVMGFNIRQRGFNRLMKKSAMFLLGFSLVLVQFFYVYGHSGDFFLFERNALKIFSDARDELNIFSQNSSKQFIELVNYTIPAHAGYWVTVNQEVNGLTIFILKVYQGIFKFEVPVYIGFMKKTHPSKWTPSVAESVKMYLLVGILLLWLLFNSLFGPKSLRVAGIIALGYVVFTGLMQHTEYRYYLFPRLVLWITTTYWIFKGLIPGAQKIRRIFNIPTGNSFLKKNS